MLPTLAETLPHWFETTRHSSFLYVASELVKVFGSDPDKQLQLGEFKFLPSACCQKPQHRY
jgi:transportin-3